MGTTTFKKTWMRVQILVTACRDGDNIDNGNKAKCYLSVNHTTKNNFPSSLYLPKNSQFFKR